MTDYSQDSKHKYYRRFSLEQHLKNYAEFEQNARVLLESFHAIKSLTTKCLIPIVSLFPHYSDHSHEHSEHVIAAIEKLLGKERIENLSPADTWMILICSYMHDIGMVIFYKELISDWPSEEFQEYISWCRSSKDADIRNAAIHVSSIDSLEDIGHWPVQIHRDVILLSAEYYRKRHSDRSKNLIERSELQRSLNHILDSNNFLQSRVQNVIIKICQSHGTSFQSVLDNLKPIDSLLGYTFHPRFISVLLRLGDLCDMDNDRFNPIAIDVIGGLTNQNYIHYYKHKFVSSFVIEKDTISVEYDISYKQIKEELLLLTTTSNSKSPAEIQDICDSVLMEAQNWMDWIADEVNHIKLKWDEFAIDDLEVFSPTLHYNILVDSHETVFSNRNLRFSFSKEKAYELITNSSLYNNSFIFVRELIQNSIDALKRQFWRDIQSGQWNHLLKKKDNIIDYNNISPFDFTDAGVVYDHYQVNIFVNHKEGDATAHFVIEDNGTGITKFDVENRIINTGSHDTINNDPIEDMPGWLRPTSAFGIGLHSVFAVTDKIFVQTRTEKDDNVYNINMHSGTDDGHVFMSVADNQKQRFCNSSHGTRIEVSIDIEKCLNHLELPHRGSENPSSPRQESSLCSAIQNMMDNVIVDPLFTVSCKFNGDNPITYHRFSDAKYVKLLFNEDCRNHIITTEYTDPNYDFAFDATGNYLILWDKIKGEVIVFSFNSRDLHKRVSYKGFSVDNENHIGDLFIEVPYISYLGGDTRGALNVSRDSFSLKQKNLNRESLLRAENTATSLYLSLLKKLLDDETVYMWYKTVEEFVESLAEIQNINKKNFIHPIEDNHFFDKFKGSIYDLSDLRVLLLIHGFSYLIKSKHDYIVERSKINNGWKNIVNSLFTSAISDKYFTKKVLGNETEIINYIQASEIILGRIVNARFYMDKNEVKNYLLSLLVPIFKDEFSKYYTKESSESDLYPTLFSSYGDGDVFGKSCTFPYYSDYALKCSDTYRHYLNGGGDSNIGLHTMLDVYLSTPLVDIVSLLLYQKTDLSPLKGKINCLLSKIPGYNNSYGFIDVHNVGEILFNPKLSIMKDDYEYKLFRNLPIVKSLPCKKIEYVENQGLRMDFASYHSPEHFIECDDKSFREMLRTKQSSCSILIQKEYEEIALTTDIAKIVTVHDFGFTYQSIDMNYHTCLWMSLGDFMLKYGKRIQPYNRDTDNNRKENEINRIVNELMPESGEYNQSINNVLRFICMNRAFNKELTYDEAWKKICEKYREFIIYILKNLPLSQS